jgi:hypothetical protein
MTTVYAVCMTVTGPTTADWNPIRKRLFTDLSRRLIDKEKARTPAKAGARTGRVVAGQGNLDQATY